MLDLCQLDLNLAARDSGVSGADVLDVLTPSRAGSLLHLIAFQLNKYVHL
jgi:hypothetical protein